ncbi:SusC/RagA family TonB-linked outer membrane protein [Sunxiuqinia elliptica]|uniref:TonB-linked SusC/RagA family outer membrane protein n=1 Tax=Sunxiuqinia elliptica TaxID=655355 RepID=A0A4R6GQB8_9BACT|nr:SusC/RagA family TonB-linked outer membrane protein [Sunxiuqinia elliptica]TDN96665.1 TonB-linked SusC/RagA family outer membrane protein [Sunxiuqinia elliptica]TDO55776.1 TonB-linked SusC/RagA family outer membrane protein [Sunxiuqinia elliptica]
MKKQIRWFQRGFIGAVLILISISMAFAQDVTIKGTVTGAEDGMPIPGVSVVEKGTVNGTITDLQGRYTLTAPSGAIVAFTFVGMKAQEVVLGTQAIVDIQMAPDAVDVDEVVVTALGIKREEKSLGYGVSKVDSEEIQSSAGSDVLSSMQGKVAGLELGSSQGGLGSSNRVVLRGNSSISGNNQPLYVVDGVPVNNSTVEVTTGVWDRKDFGSGSMDINPDDIENVTVLKGPNAAALYGSRAQNGAIIITTKSGKRGQGLGVELSSSNMFDVVTDQFLPKLQNKYGQGHYVDNVPSYSTTATDNSWGPAMAGQSLPSWSGFEENLTYSPQPDNIKDFFGTGFKTTNTIALTKGGENSSSRFSYTNLYGDGIVPGNVQHRHNFNIRAEFKLAEWLGVDTKVNYLNQEIEGGTWLGEGSSNAIFGLFSLPRNTVLSELKKYNFNNTPNDPFVGTQMNPYWTSLHDNMINKKDRLIGFAKLDFDITDNLSGFVRVGTDYTDNSVEERYNLGHKQNSSGQWILNQYKRRETNIDGLLSYRKQFGDLDFGANLGGNIMKNNSESTYNRGDDVISNGFWNIQNYLNKNASYNIYEKQVNSAYATLNLGFRDYLYLDASFRNDWSSTLPQENWSYFYPAVSASILINEIAKLTQINLLKIRLGYAEVGNDSDPYRLATTFGINPLLNHNGIPLMDVDGTPGVPNLKPEQTASFEFGMEFRAYNNRLFADLNYYSQSTENQLFTTRVSAATGYVNKYLNGGEVVNRGFELSLGGVPVKTGSFEWETTFTLAKNKTEIKELAEGIDTQVLADLGNIVGGVQIIAKKGKDGYGVIMGMPDKVDGEYQLGNNNFLPGEKRVELGNFTPDATFGWLNTFSFKRFKLRTLIDGKIGGDVMNATKGALSAAGITENTLEHRETGVEVSGVNADGEQVTVEMNAQNYWGGLANYGAPWIVDATNVRLRELSLGYTFRMNPNFFIKNLSLNFNAYNLFFIYRDEDAKDIDPNQTWGTGNAQGYNLYNVPSTTSYGFTVNVKF